MTKTVLKPDWAVATTQVRPARFPQQVTYGKGNGAPMSPSLSMNAVPF